MTRRKLNSSDPTATDAMGAAGDNYTAEELRRRARIREAADARRNEAIQLRMTARDGGGDDAA